MYHRTKDIFPDLTSKCIGNAIRLNDAKNVFNFFARKYEPNAVVITNKILEC